MARDGILPNGLMSILSAFTRHVLLWVALGANVLGFTLGLEMANRRDAST